MTGKSGFRSGILELARHVSFVGLLDTTVSPRPVTEETGGWRTWRLFGHWS
jgi:hypothetical protein